MSGTAELMQEVSPIFIDPEFAAQIPPLTDEECAQLEENIKIYGCRDPLVVWSEHGVLLDGHNRFRICNKLGVGYRTVALDFTSREGAADWIDKNQLGRRNLHPDVMSLLRGRIYNRTKKAPEDGGKGTPKSSTVDQNDPRSTAERMAKTYGVSGATIKRDGQFASAVEGLKSTIPGMEKLIQSSSAPPKQVVIDAAKATPEKKKAVEALIAGGSPESIKAALIELAGETQIVNASKSIRNERAQQRREERIEKIDAISKGNTTLGSGNDVLCPVVYADPPWKYQHSETESRAVENHYPTMETSEICSLPVDKITTKDAILFMWATSPKLEEAFNVLNAWGFTYKTCMVWDKINIGMGYYARQQHELLLIGTKGDIPPPLPANRPASVYREQRQGHSSKPEAYYSIIEAMYPGLAKIELFCRTPRAGWLSWGNQA